jgi:hypothetical protein
MKENGEKIIGQKDDAMMNFVSRQAQEAILDPNLPEYYKDYVLEGAIKTLTKIGERKSTYSAGGEESQQLKSSHTYKAK